MYRLGKKPARPVEDSTAPFSNYFTVEPDLNVDVPTRFGNLDIFNTLDWGVLGNNDVGDCVPAGFCHQIRMWRLLAYNEQIPFTDQSTEGVYSALTGWKADDPNTDTGCDVQDAAAYWRDTGVVDAAGAVHRIAGFVHVASTVEMVAAAAFIFGSCGIGIQVPAYAMDQFTSGMPWSVADPNAAIVGGHYVPVVGRNSSGNLLVVTWGRLQALTPEFFNSYCDEAYAFLSDADWLKLNRSPRGFDADLLLRDLGLIKTV